MKTIRLLCLSVVMVFFAQYAQAQGGDYKFHNIFIYNFTKYIVWPSDYQQGDFVIGVLGASPLTNQLIYWTEKKKVRGVQPIVVKQFDSPNDLRNEKVHMFFIPYSKSGYLKYVQEAVDGKPTLIITEKNGLALQGSMINFVVRNGRWTFEINEEATERAGLKVSSELLRVAIRVR
ncbi:hypothetical protein FHS56_001490 [Thermonema lapsum]|uniref:DUF4154 domain-containing protein n=1 Tax=Thermonema lapsum TaxID=28195 RepID=A0A846MRT9_9BACT|nr:YfiR family protein [Thermonema lapsum]NIK73977.1 hypothetical protein [Thermonema lapsum]